MRTLIAAAFVCVSAACVAPAFADDSTTDPMSPWFVRAGAAVGVYPDFRDIGAQTAQLAERQLSGQAVTAEEGPRKVVVAVNQRVIRLLGVEYEPRRGAEVVTLR